jgi:membrane-associated phospholipid phosphatase
MGGFWDWGVQVVLWLQTGASWLQPWMQVLSFLGTQEFLLAVGLTVYWCVDASTGVRIGLLLTSGASLGGLLKLGFHMPRPYWYDLRVRPLAGEPTYGMPSIHAIVAWSIWPWLGRRLRTPWGLAAGALLAFGVSVSRIFLGVHFPGDAIGGFAVGILVWVCVGWSIRHGGPVLERAGLFAQCAAAASASALLLLAQAGVLWALQPVADPAEWALNAARANVILPRSPVDIISLAGLILGLGAGLAFRNRWAPFRADGPAVKRILRFLIGFSVMAIIWRGLPVLWNEYAQPISMVLRYFRYGLVGFWAVFLGPWLFLRLKLAERDI